jgi:16S rRNA (guanine966-N2)-methyltransferase
MLKITGGDFRGRILQVPHHQKTRPTLGKLRQALLNSLQRELPGARVLDLFAGSGALGFEALSRGAQEVVFVEMARSALKIIEKNSETLDVKGKVRLIGAPIPAALTQLEPFLPFDLVFADPPYEAGWEIKLLMHLPWERLLVSGGYFCLEWGIQKSVVTDLPDRVPFLVKVREKNYGDSMLTTYSREKGS